VSNGASIFSALEVLEKARIHHEGGATVQENGDEYAIILIDSTLADHAIKVLNGAGFDARLGK
jgi:hypothetical protein